MKTPFLIFPALCSLIVSTVVFVGEFPRALHVFHSLSVGEGSLPDSLYLVVMGIVFIIALSSAVTTFAFFR